MKRVFIVHRWSGNPEADWYPWLKGELQKAGFEVHVPKMPDTDKPVIEAWVGALAAEVGAVDAETYFVGHSIGCQTIMRFLERQNARAGGAVLVAGWVNLANLEDAETKEIAEPWIETSINFGKVQGVCKIAVFLSDADPYDCYDENKDTFERNLGANVITVRGAGHFTEADGWSEAPSVFDEILQMSV